MRRPRAPCGNSSALTKMRAEGAGAVEVLADRPLRGALLVIAHRHVVEAAVAEHVIDGARFADMTRHPRADHERELGFVVEQRRDAGPDAGSAVADERALAAKEEPRVVGLLAAAFLGVVVVVEAEADGLAGARHERRERQRRERQAGGAAFEGATGCSDDIDAGGEGGAQVGRHRRIGAVQVDDLVAGDDTEPRLALFDEGGESQERFSSAPSGRTKRTACCACLRRAEGGAEMPQ